MISSGHRDSEEFSVMGDARIFVASDTGISLEKPLPPRIAQPFARTNGCKPKSLVMPLLNK